MKKEAKELFAKSFKANNKKIFIDNETAEAIQLIQKNKGQSKLHSHLANFCIDYPLLVSTTDDFATRIVNDGKIAVPFFDNLSHNFDLLAKSYANNNLAIDFTYEIIDELFKKNHYDFNKRISIYLLNTFHKLKEMFLNKYFHNLNSKQKLLLYKSIAKKTGVPISKIEWAITTILKDNTDDWQFKINDIDRENDEIVYKSETSLVYTANYPWMDDLVSTIATILDEDNSYFDIYYNYFIRLFSDLYVESSVMVKNHKEINREKIQIFCVYYKLLAMKIYEYFDVYRTLTSDHENVEKLAVLLIHCENCIKELEKFLK